VAGHGGLPSREGCNPLQVLKGRLELTQAEYDSPHLDDAADALDRGQTLIQDLLRVARGGGSVGDVEDVSIAALAEECWGMIPSDEDTLSVGTGQTVSAAQGRLQQLLENLLATAVEHGGKDVTVRVGAPSDGFCVADDGVGIPDGERDDVFRAGYSTAENGTGFGLRIVTQIVDAHGWEVQVTDSTEGGARFEIRGVDTS